jgi:hypothetical protein
MADQFGEIYAMRFVRMLTKFNLCDEERGIIDLPSCITNHSLFKKWCFSRRWIATTDNTGCYTFEARSTEETFWGDCETQEECSWWKFLELWRVHFPHVHIRAPCYDTCGECNIFKNSFRYREEKNKKKGIAEDDSDDDIDEYSDAEFDEPQD